MITHTRTRKYDPDSGSARYPEANGQRPSKGDYDDPCDPDALTDRERQLEEELRYTKEMYGRLIDFSGVGIIFFRRHRVIYCNSILAEIIGIENPERASLEGLFRSLHSDDLELVSRHFDELLDGLRTSSRFEFRVGNVKDPKHYRGYGQRMTYGDDPAVYFTMQDITSQVELTQKARLNEVRLIHGDRLTALGTMAAGLAHELNQPLNTIRVITEGFLFARDEGWDIDMGEMFEDLTMVSRQVSRMSSIINNIRDFARLEYGATLVDVDVNQAVENVFSMLGRQLEAQDIRVTRKPGTDLGSLRAQQTRLEQVLINLLVNAREALEDCGHDDRELWLKTERRDGYVMIELGDNATGISENLQDKVFEPFLTTKDVGKGTGLGLSISRSIVAEMGGTIEFYNNNKGGATFMVTFPESRMDYEHSSGR